jgi:hypothetical protein
MSHEVYYHFPQADGQARRCGTRGGKATARNRRARQEGAAAEAPQTQTAAARQFPRESTAAAIALLDQQYPWLRGAEQRLWNHSPGA